MHVYTHRFQNTSSAFYTSSQRTCECTSSPTRIIPLCLRTKLTPSTPWTLLMDRSCLWRVSRVVITCSMKLSLPHPPPPSPPPSSLLLSPSSLLLPARNKDNSWPEEIIAIMKEVKARDKDKDKEKAKMQGKPVSQKRSESGAEVE